MKARRAGCMTHGFRVSWLISLTWGLRRQSPRWRTLYRSSTMPEMRPTIVVHGGAGREEAEEREPRRRACVDAARHGWDVLQQGGTAVDAVVTAVLRLEDDPHFNAGTGSSFTSDGRIEMDASVMEGTRLSAGAVGALERVKNPILVARAIMEDGRHVLLVGPQALNFARSRGIPECDPDLLVVERQRRRYDTRNRADGGTVGAVAVDGSGHAAAATSTGGVMGKLPGRVGDSAVIGAGTYADDQLGAASATGVGEPIMRLTLARLAVSLLEGGCDPAWACRRSLALLEDRLAARCGLILIDVLGRIGTACTADGMPVAYMHVGLEVPADG